MKSLARCVCLLSLVVPLGQLGAQEQIAWIADVQTASAMAAEQRRLVLLHFYSDNCGPCVALDRNVFSQQNVVYALAQNYIAVKVHAGKNPQLAARYRVNRWPTDVFVTPSGLEVYRTISPDKPNEYIAVLNQVALQTGTSASRQWQSPLDQVVRPAAVEASLEAGKAAQAVGTFTGQMQQSAAQGQQATQQFQQQAADLSQRGTAAASQWSQNTLNTAQHYGQQAQHTQQQLHQSAAQVQQQVEQGVATTRQDFAKTAWQSAEQFQQAAQQTSQQFRQTAQGFGPQLQQTLTSASFDRRSSFAPADAAAAIPPATDFLPNGSAVASPSPAAAPQPPLAANNPWVVSSAAVAAAPVTSPAPPLVPGPAAPAAPPPVAASSPAFSAPPPAQTASTSSPATSTTQQLVPASQAPPIGLDGFCPVTLLETMAREPNSRSAWKKGDKLYGAIHRGRTYLFVSAEHQQRFLANPDAFAPALAGCDPVRFADRGEMVDGQRAYGLITPDRRIYLFADESSRNRFEQSPAAYSSAIQQAMLRSELGVTYR